MSVTEVEHRETWSMTIKPEEDDVDWPARHKTRWQPEIKPDTIHVHFSRNQGRYDGSIAGFRYLKDGSRVSDKLRSSESFYGGGAPEWARKIIETEIVGAGLINALMGPDA